MNSRPTKRGVFLATVEDSQTLCCDHFKLQLAVADFPPTAPGQFVQLACQSPAVAADEPDMHEWHSPADPGLRSSSLLDPLPLLRRPFSLAGDHPHPQRPGVRLLSIIGRAIGIGTRRLAALAPGQRIDLIGPLGNSFPMPAPDQTALLVGGGVGIPPMIYLAERIARQSSPAIAIAGVTSVEFLPLTCDENIPPSREMPAMCANEFAAHGIPAMITSDDGSVGMKGLVTDALARVLDSLALPAQRVVIYTCGPERMMRAVTELAGARNVSVWVAMERSMACGIGTCQSCVCKVRAVGDEANRATTGPGDWNYKLVCTDGTIFDGRQIIWQ